MPPALHDFIRTFWIMAMAELDCCNPKSFPIACSGFLEEEYYHISRFIYNSPPAFEEAAFRARWRYSRTLEQPPKGGTTNDLTKSSPIICKVQLLYEVCLTVS